MMFHFSATMRDDGDGCSFVRVIFDEFEAPDFVALVMYLLCLKTRKLFLVIGVVIVLNQLSGFGWLSRTLVSTSIFSIKLKLTLV